MLLQCGRFRFSIKLLGQSLTEVMDLLLGVRIRGTLGDIDPLNNKVPLKRATSRVQKGPL